MCFLREPWLRGVVEEACRAERLEPLGWRDVPHRRRRARLDGRRDACRGSPSCVLAPCEDERRGAARVPRAPPRRARRRRLHRLALVPHRHLQGALRRDTARELLPRPPRPELGGGVGDLPPALLDEHRAELGARAAVPPPLPQRRDQHDRGERRLDGGARAGARRSTPALAPALDRSRLRLGAARQRARAARPRGRRRLRGALAARPARLAERPTGRRRRARDAPLPRDARRAVGRAGRARLHRRRHLRREARPQRAAPARASRWAATASSSSPPRRARSRCPRASPVRRGRLGPGQLLAIDPRHGLRFDGELTRDLASRRPYAALGRREHRGSASRASPTAAPDGELAARHALHGYTREELSLMLRPIAQTGQEPVYSMGDDAPIAPLAGRARPLASYFRQRFAQVTNPAIDHYRERTVMSIATLVGAAAAARCRRSAATARRACRRSSSPPTGLEALEPACGRRDVRRRRGPRGRGRARRRRVRGARRGGGDRRLPQRRAAGRRARGDPVAARRRRRARAPHRARPAHALLDPRLERRGARHAHGRDARRLRRRRDLPAPRARDCRAPRRDRQGRRRPALGRRGAASAAARARGRRAQGDVEARHLGRRELPRRAPLRGGRPRPAAVPPRSSAGRRPAIGGIGLDRLERDALDRLAASEAREAGAREPRLLQVPQGRRAARDRPRTWSRRCRRA